LNEYVVDASAAILALVGTGRGSADLRGRLPRMRCHAPHLLDAEVGNVLRRHEQSGRISSEEAQEALSAIHAVVRLRYPHTGELAAAAWALRANLTFYDALYVALAGLLDVPLLTCDKRLSRVRRLPCHVELV
jgi:predicted nucleic acid-binding protein